MINIITLIYHKKNDKVRLHDGHTYSIFMTKQITLLNQKPDNICNEVEETKKLTQTHSGRIAKRPSRYDDYVMK